MSHFGRSGPPDITDTYSLLVLNITFRTTADDLYPIFDKCGKMSSSPEIDGRVVDGREITVKFAKYGPNAERIHKGRVSVAAPRSRYRCRSRSPRRCYREDFRDWGYWRRSQDRYDEYRLRERERRSQHSRSHSGDHRSTYSYRDRGRGCYESRSRSRSVESASPARHSISPQQSLSHGRTPSSRSISPDRYSEDRRLLTPRSVSPRD